MSKTKSDKLADVCVQVHHRTSAAVLVSDDGDEDNAVWVPLSQIEMEPEVDHGETIITGPEWLFKDKGLI